MLAEKELPSPNFRSHFLYANFETPPSIDCGRDWSWLGPTVEGAESLLFKTLLYYSQTWGPQGGPPQTENQHEPTCAAEAGLQLCWG